MEDFGGGMGRGYSRVMTRHGGLEMGVAFVKREAKTSNNARESSGERSVAKV